MGFGLQRRIAGLNPLAGSHLFVTVEAKSSGSITQDVIKGFFL